MKELELNKIHNIDCLEFMKTLPDKCIDLVLTDPPYNIGIDTWDKIEEEKYLTWMKEVLKELERILKINGSFYIFGNMKYIAEIKVFASQLGFNLVSWIIWDKGSKEQNSTRSYADVAEHLLYFVKGIGKDLDIPTSENSVRNYLREEKKKSGKSNKYFSKEFSKFYNKVGLEDRSVIEHYFSEMQWVFPSEEIYKEILQKTGFFQRDYNELKNEYKKSRYTFNHENIRIPRNPKDKRDFKYENQIMTNVWYFNNKQEMTEFNHPTIKPLELIKVIVQASSNKNDIIFDPFLGSGTTAIACKQLNRNYIGCEISKEYCKISEDRIKSISNPLF